MSEKYLLKQKALSEELDRVFQHLSYQGGDLGALGASQCDVGKERMALEGFDYRNHPIMATHSQVIPLGDIEIGRAHV